MNRISVAYFLMLKTRFAVFRRSKEKGKKIRNLALQTTKNRITRDATQIES